MSSKAACEFRILKMAAIMQTAGKYPSTSQATPRKVGISTSDSFGIKHLVSRKEIDTRRGVVFLYQTDCCETLKKSQPPCRFGLRRTSASVFVVHSIHGCSSKLILETQLSVEPLGPYSNTVVTDYITARPS